MSCQRGTFWRWRSNPSEKCVQERLTRGTVTGTMRTCRAARRCGCARCGAGAACSAISYQSLFLILVDRIMLLRPSKVDVRLPGKVNSIAYGARPVHLIITMIKRIWTSRLSTMNLSFSETPLSTERAGRSERVTSERHKPRALRSLLSSPPSR